jgi:uncharacterized membrane protein YraQ (UPF0718 family)
MVNYILAGLLVVTLASVYRKEGRHGVKAGLLSSAKTVLMVLPLILMGVIFAGMVEVILPGDLISDWMGSGSGLRGILIGTAAGMLIPGGPYVVVPLIASIMESGAGPGPVAAFFTAWGVVPISRTLIWEVPFLGVAFTGARVIVNLGFPILVGLTTPWVYGLFT